MAKYLISGNKGGLGKYLHNAIPNSIGFGRNEFNLARSEEFNTVIHCAFNKTNTPIDYYQYLEDNIFLTQDIINLKPSKLVYISTIDVYNPNPTMYGLFKKFTESIIEKYPSSLILRCSMMIGDTMKPNHITKIKENYPQIGLSPDSTFNYILMEDILEFFTSGDYLNYKGVIDFISNDNIQLAKVKSYFNSSTTLGDYTYSSPTLEYINPIYTLNSKYNKSSLKNLQKYFK